MAFSPPTFNLVVAYWQGFTAVSTVPPFAPADGTFLGQLRLYKTAFLTSAFIAGLGLSGPGRVALCCPAGTDVRGWWGLGGAGPSAGGTLVEVPSASGRYYQVAWVDDVAKGFANEYRLAVLLPRYSPLPIP